MTTDKLFTATAVLRAVCAALVFLAVLILLFKRTDKLILSACREISGLISRKGRRTGWYLETEGMLKRTGAAFHFGRGISPGKYLAAGVLCALTGFFAGSAFSTVCGIAFSALMWLMPMLLLAYLNKVDNEKMLADIKLVYSSLAMQIRAGINMSNALLECYGGVREKRLRSALLELASDLVVKSDIFKALEDFQSKFDNRYIDSLCITVLQALESGQAVELLGDISEQIKDMEGSVMEKKKGKLDRSITFYQLGILTAVLIVILYACVDYMFSAALSF
ncbi:MAG: type II secretion system F family protein [Lachnospiraceae bacterium]|nr:type II secretion system F family protein [Lachnospiraceae bacterium]